ncbi:hypothetical protein ACMFMG_012236 [Clarireedia jacksonii]
MAMDTSTSPTLPATRKFNPQIDISGLSDDLSTDPLNRPTPNTTTGPGTIPFRLPKRANTFTPARNNKNPKITSEQTASTQPASTNPANLLILEARDLLVKAYTVTSSRDQQTQILDLIEVFRDYAEFGKVKKVTDQLASQINNLEHATRRAEIQAKAKVEAEAEAKAKANSQPPAQAKSTKPAQPTFANIAASGALKASDWTTVQAKPKQVKAKTQNRLILIRDTSSLFSAISVRNSINKAFEAKGVKGPVVSAITSTTNKKNLVLTTSAPYTTDFLIEKLDIWKNLINFKTIQKDEPWFKVVLHGIPTLEFNTPDGIGLVLEELKTFNASLNVKPIGTPYWLSSEANRAAKRAGSVVVSFKTSEEVDRCIRHQVFIGGTSVKAEKLLSVAKSTQCTKCQGFGHVTQFCKRQAKCGLCSQPHMTNQHFCSLCATRGKACSHLALRCTNCFENHASNSKLCEVYKATKRTLVFGPESIT